jgi:hypothetical protein
MTKSVALPLAPPDPGFDERIQVTVKDGVGVANLDLSAQIFHHLVRR